MVRSLEGVDKLIDLNTGSDSPVQCSICFELVECDGGRSNVKLQCGHEFHLDCIGSAFNMKGIMQCPNCRNVEKGQWLYAIGSSNSTTDFSVGAWTAENYPFLLVPYGFQICPFRGLMETDDLSIAGRDYFEHHENFVQTFPPGFAYASNFRPQPHGPLNPSDDQTDGLNFTPLDNSHRQNEIYNAFHAFTSPDMEYQPWPHHSSLTPFPTTASTHMFVASQQLPLLNPRPLGGESEALTRPRSYVHPLSLNQRPAGSSLVSLVGPPAHGVVRAPLNPFHQHLHFMGVHWPFIPGARSPNGPRSLSTIAPAGHPSDPGAIGSYYPPPLAPSSYNFHATGHVPVPNFSHAWGRDRIHHFYVMPHHDRWLRL